MLDLLDAHGSDRGARQRAEQYAAQRVAQGRAESGAQRLGDEPRVGIRILFYLDLCRFKLVQCRSSLGEQPRLGQSNRGACHVRHDHYRE